MQRRKFLIGAGSLAAGSAAVMGTGAFAVDAEDREATGTVEADDVAYLGLIPNTDDGYSYIDGDGELTVELANLNQKSVTQLDDVFYIQNNGTENVVVRINDLTNSESDVSINSVPVTSDANGNTNGNDTGSELLNTFGANLAVGERIGVGVEIDLEDVPDGESTNFQFSVDADAV